jgi:hypothetical protein
MSDTPRTDEVLEGYDAARSIMLEKLAKELECELNAALAANDELIVRLRERTESHLAASARDVQVIQQQSILLEKLERALALIAEEYEDRRFQFGDEYLWQKHEGENPLPIAHSALEAYELQKGKS